MGADVNDAGRDLYLIRHPRLVGGDGLCYGRHDLPLADNPADLAAQLAAALPAACHLVSSPAPRCEALAALLAARLQTALHLDARLLEMHFGDWEGQRWDDLPRAAIDAWATDPLHFAPPGGESAAQVQARVLAWAAEHARARAELPLVAVAHAGPIRLLLAHWQDVPPARWHEIRVDFASITSVRLHADGTASQWDSRVG